MSAFCASFAHGYYNKFQFITRRVFTSIKESQELKNSPEKSLSQETIHPNSLLNRKAIYEVCLPSMEVLMLLCFVGKTQHRRANRSPAETM